MNERSFPELFFRIVRESDRKKLWAISRIHHPKGTNDGTSCRFMIGMDRVTRIERNQTSWSCLLNQGKNTVGKCCFILEFNSLITKSPHLKIRNLHFRSSIDQLTFTNRCELFPVRKDRASHVTSHLTKRQTSVCDRTTIFSVLDDRTSRTEGFVIRVREDDE